MIILPERGIARGKLLLPMRPAEWRAPSQRATTYGIENKTRWRLTGRLNDGHVAWRGWFDDRDDADAFMWALACGTLMYERELWRLPTPAWHPGIGEHVNYDFATQTNLTSPTGSNQTWNRPADWSNTTNAIHTIGGGGKGGDGTGSVPCGHGGGAGAYSGIVNLSPGATATYQIGAAAGDTWFNAATLGASSVGAKGGTDAGGSAGVGGAAASGIGTVKKNGGAGGTGDNFIGGGGAGAAGPDADGSPGASPGNGGDANGGLNGGGLGGNPGSGGDGSTWTTVGPGGGGHGGDTGAHSGSDAGLYGGAGGGAYALLASNGGLGKQGIIVIIYTPVARGGFNMPMLGM